MTLEADLDSSIADRREDNNWKWRWRKDPRGIVEMSQLSDLNALFGQVGIEDRPDT